jgi:hypothetical protein
VTLVSGIPPRLPSLEASSPSRRSRSEYFGGRNEETILIWDPLSFCSTVTPAKAAILSNGLGPYFLTGDIELPGSYEIAVSNFDTTVTDDGCTAYGAGSMTGKVALIKRGTCSFSVKAQNALE